jgi:predicted 3-demethylubiquinone-9 3-methyltransferase (glyoxalase superfamily)
LSTYLCKKITPCLWFDDNAEEAVKFYTSLFRNSKVLQISYYGEAGSSAAERPKGSVMTITFQLDGQGFMALNGGPHFKFTAAISVMVNCETQAEIDKYWDKLSAGGATQPCGWLTDKFGVSWQIVPAVLAEMMQDDQAEKSERVMKAIFEMEKLDLPTLAKAYAGK